tara:strand:+ start:5568 stop:5981 length:414 start_codon:yes stop_codon:yes gene_type:complete
MQHLVNELKTLISHGVKQHPLPVKVGNSIRIGPVVIRQLKDKSFILFDSKEQIQIGSVYSKHSALALAKLYTEHKDIDFVISLDKKLQKHDLDARYYQHSMDKTEDITKKDILDTRLSVAHDELRIITNKLEQIIFN